MEAAAALAVLFPLNLFGGRGPSGKGDGGPLDNAELKDRGVARCSSLSRGDGDENRGLHALLFSGSGLPSCESGDEGPFERGVTFSSPHALAP